MAAYPSLTPYPGSVAVPSVNTQQFVDGAGGHHVYWPPQKMRFTLKHILNTADDNALRAIFIANKLASLTFVWFEDGQTYNVKFLSPPRREGIADGAVLDRRNVTVELGEV